MLERCESAVCTSTEVLNDHAARIPTRLAICKSGHWAQPTISVFLLVVATESTESDPPVESGVEQVKG
jgi:hypothetical protein